MADIRISTADGKQALYPEEQIRTMWQQGLIANTTLYWKEGMSEWRPLREYFSAPSFNTSLPPPVPMVASHPTVEKKGSGCWVAIQRVFVIMFVLGFIINLMEKGSQNTKTDAAMAQATYSAAVQLGHMVNNMLRTQYASESERMRFGATRASEIARIPNLDPDFLGFLHSLIAYLSKLQTTMHNFEAELQSVTNAAEIVAALGHIYGLQQTQNSSDGTLAELLFRMGVAQGVRQDIEAIVARNEPNISRLRTDYINLLGQLEPLLRILKQRYPQYDFERI